MPDPKDHAKMTGDTHLPDVESDYPMDEGLSDTVGADGTPRDRGQATEHGDKSRAGRGRRKAGGLKEKDAQAGASPGKARAAGQGKAEPDQGE